MRSKCSGDSQQCMLSASKSYISLTRGKKISHPSTPLPFEHNSKQGALSHHMPAAEKVADAGCYKTPLGSQSAV